MSPASRHAVLAAFALFACLWRTYTVQQREAALALTFDAETRGPVPIPPSERSLQTVVGGGQIKGGSLQAGLVDEVSLLLLPGIDGRHAIPAIFDGVVDHHSVVPLKLESVEKREGDALWIRYEVSRPTSDHK